ncbi:hypothetical protein HPB49_007825 [Dermacentor silvarum]|uniref:Uncharacterized protein n=1 Tax=Dermacentor silvarum TaxID=543639 RepID=A0ACB8CVX4_DERSI|nr:hypothetical protein HPB49_007825 [Dermacentor silvarum]
MDDKDALQQQLELLQRQLQTQQVVIEKQMQHLQERHRQLNDSVQQHPGDASATLAASAGSTEVVRAPADEIQCAAPHDVWRVAVKLPPFWADSPEVWLALVEAQFSLARNTQDRTRYDYVVAHIDARYANQVRDILANSPKSNLYEHFKTELIRRLSLSEEPKVRQLQSAELAERKPSQLLRHMRALAGNMEVPDSLLRALWLQRLAPHIQAILQAQLALPLDQLAGIADCVIEVSLPQFSPPSRLSPQRRTPQSLRAASTVTIDSSAPFNDAWITTCRPITRKAMALTPPRRSSLVTTTGATTIDASVTEHSMSTTLLRWT